LEESGVNLRSAKPDLVVAPSGLIDDAIASGAEMLIIEGGDVRKALNASGFHARRYVPLPNADEPQLFVPLGSTVARYALRSRMTAWKRWKRVRNLIAGECLSRGLLPPMHPLVTVAAREPGHPFLVTEATTLGVPSNADWILICGEGDILARATFLIFQRGRSVPGWALKFKRLRGADERVEIERRGLQLARNGGETVAGHVPRFFGRIEHAGFVASLESAAEGQLLNDYLLSTVSKRSKLKVIDYVVSWLVEIARTTSASPDFLEPERARLLRDVVPYWSDLGASADLVQELPPLRAVCQHNDLGTWNILVQSSNFTVLDWEAARSHGLPVWDALYFLSDAIAHLDGACGPAARAAHFTRLFLGELKSSELLATWLARVLETSGVPAEALGGLATLCWLHHALADRTRRQQAGLYNPSSDDPSWVAAERARVWLTAPGLGPHWKLPT
jgi:hypothetical protein